MANVKHSRHQDANSSGIDSLELAQAIYVQMATDHANAGTTLEHLAQKATVAAEAFCNHWRQRNNKQAPLTDKQAAPGADQPKGLTNG